MSSDQQTDKAMITFGVQSGDMRASEATEPHFMPLRRLLEEYCRGPYSPEVDEFAIVLRVDGEIWHWEKEGCDYMRRSKKGRYITIDIFVPRERWEGASGLEIRRYLATWTEVALKRMIGKLQRDKAPVDEPALLRDLAIVKERFLLQDEAVSAGRAS